jgi:hypothetical protein
MISNYILRGLKFVLYAVLFVAALAMLGLVVKSLWNWLMPALFGWKLIGYWQAVGLIILSKILFGGISGSRGPGGYRRRRMSERWKQMTPEERDKFRQRIYSCWSRVAPPDSKASA